MTDRPRLILIRGVPGSGKSTFAAKVFPDILKLENDMFHMRGGKYCFSYANQPMAVKKCFDMTAMMLNQGADVVVANTFTKKKYIDGYKKLAEAFNAKFVVYRLCGKFDNVHSVPKDVLENMTAGFEDYADEVIVHPEGELYSEMKNGRLV